MRKKETETQKKLEEDAEKKLKAVIEGSKHTHSEIYKHLITAHAEVAAEIDDAFAEKTGKERTANLLKLRKKRAALELYKRNVLEHTTEVDILQEVIKQGDSAAFDLLNKSQDKHENWIENEIADDIDKQVMYLHLASQSPCRFILDYFLIEKKIDADSKNAAGETALHLAR